MGNNTYILIDRQEFKAAIIDPSFGVEQILREIPPRVTVDQVLLTHGHFDHVAGVTEVVERLGARVGIHPADIPLMRDAALRGAALHMPTPDAPEPDFQFVPGEPVMVGGLELEVRHTPGHSPGSVTLVCDDAAFVGDTLFAGSIGRTDLGGGDYEQLLESIQTQIMSLPDTTRVLSGHGPETTVGRERRTNAFLKGEIRFAER